MISGVRLSFRGLPNRNVNSSPPITSSINSGSALTFKLSLTWCPIVPQTVNFVNDALHLQLVISDCANYAVRIVEPANVCHFRRVEILNSGSRWAIYQIVGWMPAGLSNHFKHRVGPKRAVRP